MNENRYRWILYTIVIVIIATIGIQIYWNYKNYFANKQQLINDVQISLDKAVDDYYADLAEKTTLGLTFKDNGQENILSEDSEISKLLGSLDASNGKFNNLDSLELNSIEGISVFRGRQVDSLNKADAENNPAISTDSFKNQIKDLKVTTGKDALSDIKILTSKIVISISNDTLDLDKVDSLLSDELNRKSIAVDYNLNFNNPKKKNKNEEFITVQSDSSFTSNDMVLKTYSNSTFLPKNSKLSIAFTNVTKTILMRILGGILISTLLVLAVIASLFYLLNIIKNQKQVAEVKNDLISNITHEFKTPISTIGVALESIKDFNGIDDKEKTKKYIDMSTQQLDKLNVMVEKLLETATLDSDNLELNKEAVNIAQLLGALVNRYKLQFADKDFERIFNADSHIANVDVFHFENAINNILDNAVKYGGDTISIDLISKKDKLVIKISDTGTILSKDSKDRIFEKFYRIPKGNTHDVKGFGIGLYYTKTIIEKHNGSVDVDLSKNLTTFKITLPNG
jgi:two-component system phosphate regulon sensor histidine kinase PhoR